MKSTILVLGSVMALAGCVDGEELDVSADPTPRLSANGLLPSQLESVDWSPAELTQSQLDAYAATADGRASLRYVLACALASGTTLNANYIDDNGEPATARFAGSLGFAPNWTTAAMSIAEQQAVTSCAASLTNEVGANIMISQRGPGAILATTSTERATYTVQEGAYFGNMFTLGILVCSGSGTSTQPGRTCASGASCYTNVGSCASTCATSPNGYFVNCSVKGTIYAAPVTVYDSI